MPCCSNCLAATIDHLVKPTDALTTVVDVLRWSATAFSRAQLYYGHGTDNAWDDAVALVAGRLGIAAEKLQFVMSARLTTRERDELIRLAQRRIVQRVPVPYLVGEAWFVGQRFLVAPGVLIPRSPIGELIESGFEPWLAQPPGRILDIGTGSGCLGIACAHAFPEATVVLSDVSDAALALARRNVELHGVADRVAVVHADVFDGLPPGQFDLIVANPPYVSAADLAAMPAEFAHEPVEALAAGVDGLAIMRRILAGAHERLSPDGLLVGEVGASAAQLIEAFPALPFTWPNLERGGDGVFLLERVGLS
jgi:ribosomal protein L3 glutamine methyltransferase